MPRRKYTVATKLCRTCQRRKPLAAFWRSADSPDGRDRWCRDCRASYFRRWRAANRDHGTRWERAYRRENRERYRAYNREYQRRRRALMRAGKWKTKRGR